jgi:pimeloyl-ACP methyl ester carboxylesterase
VRLSLFENRGYARPAPEPPSMEIGTLARGRARLRCGEVAYLRHGSGPPLLLVHGIPTSARLWEPLLGDLGEHFDCIVPDLLGLGYSRPRPGAALDSAGQAAMLTELLDRLGVDEVLAVFHDQGGAHGMQFLRDDGERVRAAVFCDVVCYDNWLVPPVELMGAMCRAPTVLGAAARTGLLNALLLGLWPFPQATERAPLPRALTDDWMHPLHAGREELHAFCTYVRAQSPRYTTSAVPALQGWTKPALVVWAAHDRFLSPSWAVRLARDLAGAPDEPVLLPFAGHFFHHDVPRTAARVLLDFLTVPA